MKLALGKRIRFYGRELNLAAYTPRLCVLSLRARQGIRDNILSRSVMLYGVVSFVLTWYAEDEQSVFNDRLGDTYEVGR